MLVGLAAVAERQPPLDEDSLYEDGYPTLAQMLEAFDREKRPNRMNREVPRGRGTARKAINLNNS